MIEAQQRDHCPGCGIALAPIDPDDPNDFGELCAACLAAHPTRAARRRRTAGDQHPRQTLGKGSDRYYTAVETFRSLPLDDPRPSQLALF
jgi:hypothetical protein